MPYTHPEYLTSTNDLAAALKAHPDNLVILDATIHLVPAEKGYKAISGKEDYNKGHIPGAIFMDLMANFADKESRFNFMMPSDAHLQESYRALGINNASRVVIYATGHPMWATRAWWMLHSLGHKNVSVLDGGFAKWAAEGQAISTDTPQSTQGDFTPNRNEDRWADKAQVVAAIEDGDVCTINALSPDVYSGEAKMSYGRKGHITNSINVFYDDVLNDGCFRSAEELTQLFKAKGTLDKPRTITYCGGGISATIDALALALIGYENVAVYDGSMGEWAADETLPLVLGQS